MRLDDLIRDLQQERGIHGNLEVAVQGTVIDHDGEVKEGHRVNEPVYQIMRDKQADDMVMVFERVMYESGR